MQDVAAPMAQTERSCTLEYVDPKNLGHVVPLVRHRLKAIAERSGGRWTVESLIGEFATRNWDLLAICGGGEIVGIVATHLVQHPSGMITLEIPFMTGENRKEWLFLLDLIEAHAKRNGAQKMTFWARPGWASELHDYKKTHLMLEKDLT